MTNHIQGNPMTIVEFFQKKLYGQDIFKVLKGKNSTYHTLYGKVGTKL